jgi:hypothetical protein
MIRVIETSTSERNAETKRKFDLIQPLLDEGYTYMTALVKVGEIEPHLTSNAYNRGWFRHLKEYGAERGYPYYEYSGKKRRK